MQTSGQKSFGQVFHNLLKYNDNQKSGFVSY